MHALRFIPLVEVNTKGCVGCVADHEEISGKSYNLAAFIKSMRDKNLIQDVCCTTQK